MPGTKGKKSRKDNRGRILPKGWSQRSDGRYQCRFTYKGKRYCIYDMDFENLKRKEVELKNRLYMNLDYKNKKITLNEWFNDWINAYKKNVIKETTYMQYRRDWKNHVVDDLGREKLIEIRQIDIVNFYNRLQRKGLSVNTIKSIHKVISSVFKSAVSNGFLYYSPATNATIALGKDEVTEKVPLSREEEKRFFKALSYSKKNKIMYYTMFATLFQTGLRVGELTALQWEDIDFENHVIHINKAMNVITDIDTNKSIKAVNTPKTSESIRMVPLNDTLEKYYTLLKKHQRMEGIKCVENVSGFQDFVFITNYGNCYTSVSMYHLTKEKISKYNKREVKRVKEEGGKAELLRHFSPHLIRHTFATRCSENGIELHELQQVMGHAKDSRVTRAVYVHYNKEKALETVRNVSDKLMEVEILDMV